MKFGLPLLIGLLLADYVLIKKVKIEADFFTTDKLGNSYVVKAHEMFKYQPNANLEYQFSNLSYGNITFVDASNPLKILVFYKDFSRIVFLDNTLSENQSPITLQDMGLEQSSIVCSSYDNGLWLYDPVNFGLYRFDQELQMQLEIKNVNQLTREIIQPNFMVEAGEWIYLNDPEKGIFVFDLFGTFFKQVPIKGLFAFQVFGEEIYYYQHNQLNSYHIRKMAENSYSLPEHGCKAVRSEKDRLMLLKDKGLSIYQVK